MCRIALYSTLRRLQNRLFFDMVGLERGAFMNTNAVGALIAQIRKEKNWTQKMLAERLCVSDKTISKWETGRGMPDVSSLEHLSSVLEISVNELLAGKRFEQSEFPKESDTVLVHTMRRYRKVWCILLAAVIGAILIGTVSFFGYHWFSTFDGDDAEALHRHTKEASALWTGNENVEFEICAVEKQGAYMVSLVQCGDIYSIVQFERDSVFENRWRAWGGSAADAGELSSYHVKVGANPTLIVVFGGELPENAAYYAVRTEKTFFSLSPITNRQALDIHLQTDTGDLGSPPLLLDKNLRILNYGDGSLTDEMELYTEAAR